MKPQDKNWPLFEIPASGKKTHDGGAFCTAFVLSKDHGNYVCTGYVKEVKEFLKTRGKSIVNFCLHHAGKKRTATDTFGCNFQIYENKRTFIDKSTKKKFTIYVNVDGSRETIHIKRFPNRFINFAESLEQFVNKTQVVFTAVKFPQNKPAINSLVFINVMERLLPVLYTEKGFIAADGTKTFNKVTQYYEQKC